jgi:hypothetical protein
MVACFELKAFGNLREQSTVHCEQKEAISKEAVSIQPETDSS